MTRSVVAIVFVSLFLIVVSLASAVCSGFSLLVLYRLIKDTGPGNGAKYRYWFQIALKNAAVCLLEHLVNLIVVVTADSAGDWILSEPVCFITGYCHVTLMILGLSFLCCLQFYQYLAVVITPQAHPKYLHNLILWVLSWCLPVVIVAFLPLSAATDIQFSYNRFSCTFQRVGNVNHDTALLVLISTSLGFTCVFCAILTLKVFAALKEDSVLEQDARHISLFGDKLVKERRHTAIITADTHRADFKLLALLTIVNIVVLLPYIIVIFMASANSGSIPREVEELAILALRLIPLLDFMVLMQDIMFRSRILDLLKSLDYTFKCFYLRNTLCVGSKITPHST